MPQVVKAVRSSYNRIVKIENLHGWQLSVPQAMELQRHLAAQVSRSGRVVNPRLIAGVDIAVGKRGEEATAAVVVLRFPGFDVVDVKVVKGRLDFPYIPGLLSFRESPLTLAACEQLTVAPDLVLVDGQGIAHPRRMGLASHLGLFLNAPTIGCAKSLLCGEHKEPGSEPGSYAEVMDKGEVIGVVLRTMPGAKPVCVSIGHKIELDNAIHWVMQCCRSNRLPEPSRLAHLAAGGKLEQKVPTSEAVYQTKLF